MAYQKVQLITGVERRRRWSVEDKLRIVAEAEQPDAIVAHVARHYGICRSVLRRWRRAAEVGELVVEPSGLSTRLQSPSVTPAPLEFIPLGVFSRAGDEGPGLSATSASPVPPTDADPRTMRPSLTQPVVEHRAGAIEIDLPSGARVRVDAFVNEKALRRVFQAMKRTT